MISIKMELSGIWEEGAVWAAKGEDSAAFIEKTIVGVTEDYYRQMKRDERLAKEAQAEAVITEEIALAKAVKVK
jgi:hypothetical protein